jgi:hypothetical protein
MDAELALFTARPTTLYGIAALLLHVTTATDDGEEGETIYEYARSWRMRSQTFISGSPARPATSSRGGPHERHHSRSDLRCHQTRTTSL